MSAARSHRVPRWSARSASIVTSSTCASSTTGPLTATRPCATCLRASRAFWRASSIARRCAGSITYRRERLHHAARMGRVRVQQRDAYVLVALELPQTEREREEGESQQGEGSERKPARLRFLPRPGEPVRGRHAQRKGRRGQRAVQVVVELGQHPLVELREREPRDQGRDREGAQPTRPARRERVEPVHDVAGRAGRARAAAPA